MCICISHWIWSNRVSETNFLTDENTFHHFAPINYFKTLGKNTDSSPSCNKNTRKRPSPHLPSIIVPEKYLPVYQHYIRSRTTHTEQLWTSCPRGKWIFWLPVNDIKRGWSALVSWGISITCHKQVARTGKRRWKCFRFYASREVEIEWKKKEKTGVFVCVLFL